MPLSIHNLEDYFTYTGRASVTGDINLALSLDDPINGEDTFHIQLSSVVPYLSAQDSIGGTFSVGGNNLVRKSIGTYPDITSSSIDLQFDRTYSYQTAEGHSSAIIGGCDNRITNLGYEGVIIGGSENCLNSHNGLIIGSSNNINGGSYSGVIGLNNTLCNSNYSFIIGSSILATGNNTLFVNNLSSKEFLYGKDLTISNCVRAATLSATGNVYAGGYLNVCNQAQLADGLIAGGLVITGAGILTTNQKISAANIDICKDLRVGSPGNTTNGYLTIYTPTSILNNTTIDGNFEVQTGTITSCTLNVTGENNIGDVEILSVGNDSLNVYGDGSVSFTSMLSTLSGCFINISGDTDVNTLNVRGNANFEGILDVSSINTQNDVNIAGELCTAGNISADGVIKANDNLYVVGNTNTDTLIARGTTALGGQVTLGAGLYVEDVASFDGCIQANGGLSITGNTDIQGNVVIALSSSTLTIGGQAILDGGLWVRDGASQFTDGLTVGDGTYDYCFDSQGNIVANGVSVNNITVDDTVCLTDLNTKYLNVTDTSVLLNPNDTILSVQNGSLIVNCGGVTNACDLYVTNNITTGCITAGAVTSNTVCIPGGQGSGITNCGAFNSVSLNITCGATFGNTVTINGALSATNIIGNVILPNTYIIYSGDVGAPALFLCDASVRDAIFLELNDANGGNAYVCAETATYVRKDKTIKNSTVTAIPVCKGGVCVTNIPAGGCKIFLGNTTSWDIF